jgi:hypothetical protein
MATILLATLLCAGVSVAYSVFTHEADLRNNILNFYADLSLPLETKKDSARWQSVLSSLDQLKLFVPAPILAAGPAN